MKNPRPTIIKIQSFVIEDFAFKPQSPKKIIYRLLQKIRSTGLIPYSKPQVLTLDWKNPEE